MSDSIGLIRCQINSLPGFDVRFTSPKVTLGQLLEEINRFYAEDGLPRLWPEDRNDCRGCDLCCHEPLPITSIDADLIRDYLRLDAAGLFGHLWVEEQDHAVDITLRRGKGGRCTFLSMEGTCRIYPVRPFACQTYLCCRTSDNFENLRSQVINTGMDELVRSSIEVFRQQGRSLPVNQGRTSRVVASHWLCNCFTGKNRYDQIRIIKVLSSDLWRSMLLLK